MKIKIEIIDNQYQYHCHPDTLTRGDFDTATIDRAVREAVLDSGYQICRNETVVANTAHVPETIWILMPVGNLDTWEYTDPA